MVLYLILEMSFYVPSLRRNLISVSRLDSDGFDCHFGDGRCEIMFNKKCVDLSFRQDELYLLSLGENVIVVSTEKVNVSSTTNLKNKWKRIDDVSSKLWHCCLGHISRGEIECLIKKSILQPLEFSI